MFENIETTKPPHLVCGERVYSGMPIGSEIYCCGITDCQKEESPYFYPFIWVFGENYNGYDFDFADDFGKLDKALSADLNANNADLSELCGSGGKIIAYSGTADPCVPYPDAIKYYNRICKNLGGYEKSRLVF